MDSARELVTAHDRKSQVDERQLGPLALNALDARQPVGSGAPLTCVSLTRLHASPFNSRVREQNICQLTDEASVMWGWPGLPDSSRRMAIRIARFVLALCSCDFRRTLRTCERCAVVSSRRALPSPLRAPRPPPPPHPRPPTPPPPPPRR